MVHTAWRDGALLLYVPGRENTPHINPACPPSPRQMKMVEPQKPKIYTMMAWV